MHVPVVVSDTLTPPRPFRLAGNRAGALVRGAVVDISSEKIFTIKACREELSRPFFTFGPLLTVCDDQKLEALPSISSEKARDRAVRSIRLDGTTNQTTID
jgi:hypothetical protein